MRKEMSSLASSFGRRPIFTAAWGIALSFIRESIAGRTMLLGLTPWLFFTGSPVEMVLRPPRQQRDYNIDKLGVTGSSPVSPTHVSHCVGTRLECGDSSPLSFFLSFLLPYSLAARLQLPLVPKSPSFTSSSLGTHASRSSASSDPPSRRRDCQAAWCRNVTGAPRPPPAAEGQAGGPLPARTSLASCPVLIDNKALRGNNLLKMPSYAVSF